MRELVLPQAGGVEVRNVVRDVAGDDAVVVLWITLRFGQPLTAPEGTAIEVRALRHATIELRNELLRRDGHLVYGAVAVVDDLLGMIVGKRTAATSVAGIGTRGHISGSEGSCHRRVHDDAAERAASDCLKTAVPSI